MRRDGLCAKLKVEACREKVVGSTSSVLDARDEDEVMAGTGFLFHMQHLQSFSLHRLFFQMNHLSWNVTS